MIDEYVEYIVEKVPFFYQEPILLKYFNSLENIIIFDIGAFKGENSIRYSRIFPNANIFTFDPLEENYLEIQKNTKKYNCKNIKPFMFALDKSKGEKDFFISSSNIEKDKNKTQSSSLLQPDIHLKMYEWCEFNQFRKVKVETLKNFCLEHNIREIDFIHMDVQGAELNVLQGAGIFFNKIKTIWLEVSDISLYKNQPLKNDVESFMELRNFKKIADTVVQGDSGDQFYINKNYFKNT